MLQKILAIGLSVLHNYFDNYFDSTKLLF